MNPTYYYLLCMIVQHQAGALSLGNDFIEFTNLALGKPTWQSSTLGSQSSDKAVDGSKSNLVSSNSSCAESAWDSIDDVTWFVDLGTIQQIRNIQIYFLTDTKIFHVQSIYSLRTTGFSLYVSNTTDKDDGHVCIDNKFSQAIFDEEGFSCEVLGRYVIYHNVKKTIKRGQTYHTIGTHLDLCEVEVVGCPLGYYGTKCSKRCRGPCDQCELVYGTCIGRCHQGYYGHQCQHYGRENLALYKPTFQSSSYGRYVGAATDGKKSDLSIQGGRCVETKYLRFSAHVGVDLGGIRRIERLRIYAITGNEKWGPENLYTGRFLGVSLVVSNTTDPSAGVSCYVDINNTRSTIPAILDVSCPMIGRYVILRNDRYHGVLFNREYSFYAHASICEMEVFGCPFPDFDGSDCAIPCRSICKNDLENLAFNKPTWQSSTRSSLFKSESAVDGVKGSFLTGRLCTSTEDNKRSATWWVNLERISAIEKVVIHFRTENLPWNQYSRFAGYALGFRLYVSNTTNRHDGVLCYEDTSYTRSTIPSVGNYSCPLKGQYVIYHVERQEGVTYPSEYSPFAHADLCEVEVWGCPVPVTEAPQCSEPCPANCEQCYPDTGICQKCKPGYTGETCESVCRGRFASLSVKPKGVFSLSSFEPLESPSGVILPPGPPDYRFYMLFKAPHGGLNIANISFTMDFPKSLQFDMVTVHDEFYQVMGPNFGSLKNTFTIENPYESKIKSILLVIVYDKQTTLANFTVNLRNCI